MPSSSLGPGHSGFPYMFHKISKIFVLPFRSPAVDGLSWSQAVWGEMLVWRASFRVNSGRFASPLGWGNYDRIPRARTLVSIPALIPESVVAFRGSVRFSSIPKTPQLPSAGETNEDKW